MTNRLRQKMEEEVLKLPIEKQEAINSFDWVKSTEEIAKKHLFTEDELNDFQLETGLVLIGLVDFNLYTVNIENNVGTSLDEAKEIALEVLNNILTPIADKIEALVKNKNPNWEQRVKFILSGGDYSNFIEEK